METANRHKCTTTSEPMKAKAGVAGGGWGKNGAGDSVREVRMDNTGQVCELEK